MTAWGQNSFWRHKSEHMLSYPIAGYMYCVFSMDLLVKSPRYTVYLMLVWTMYMPNCPSYCSTHFWDISKQKSRHSRQLRLEHTKYACIHFHGKKHELVRVFRLKYVWTMMIQCGGAQLLMGWVGCWEDGPEFESCFTSSELWRPFTCVIHLYSTVGSSSYEFNESTTLDTIV